VDTFFWIIILAFLIPMGIRLYRRSARGRNQNQDLTGPFPGQLPGDKPGPFPGPLPGPKNNEYRDGYTQRDYFGGFGAFNQPEQPGPQTGGQPFGQQPGFPPQGPPFPNPGQPGYPGQGTYPGPGGYPGKVPYEDSPEYGEQQSQLSQQPPAQQPSAPTTPPPPSAPQGYRARKLAELDEQYSNGEIAMEEYMAKRAEIMKG
jgi:hypothetical protein